MWQKTKNLYHLFVAVSSNILFHFPAKKLTIIGVTGTDGKTTTVNLIYHILKSSGKSVSMLSSVGAYIGGKEYDTGFHVTTPSPFSLQSFLRKAVVAKSEYFVLEVTSHALDQHRIWGIPIKVGVLTNITHEHLDYHKTFENYLNTKLKLLQIADCDVVNRDDPSYKLLTRIKNSKSDSNWVTYGLSDNFRFDSEVLLGDFNRSNALAAVSVCRVLGLSDKEIDMAIKTFKMPTGRLDYVYEKDFSVVIDFAHTPNAFEQLLSSLRPKVKGRLIHVFGSAGERDSEKRPLMGKVSSDYADILFLTSEDPRSEDANKIIDEIESGIKKKDVKVFKIADRKEAITAAIKMADKKDMVLITGKAHEKSMNYSGKEEPWDEYKIVAEALSNRGNNDTSKK